MAVHSKVLTWVSFMEPSLIGGPEIGLRDWQGVLTGVPNHVSHGFGKGFEEVWNVVGGGGGRSVGVVVALLTLWLKWWWWL